MSTRCEGKGKSSKDKILCVFISSSLEDVEYSFQFYLLLSNMTEYHDDTEIDETRDLSDPMYGMKDDLVRVFTLPDDKDFNPEETQERVEWIFSDGEDHIHQSAGGRSLLVLSNDLSWSGQS